MADDLAGGPKRRKLDKRYLAVSLVGAVAVVLAGVLVVRGVIGTTLEDGMPIPVSGPSARVEAGGLTLSMRISSGPYFLGELIAADLRLENQSQTTYTFQGVPRVYACAQSINVDLSGGGPPELGHLPLYDRRCAFLDSQLPPGHTWLLHMLVPLTASGVAMLTEQVSIITWTTGPNGEQQGSNGPGPFQSHWPQIPLTIASQAPSDHMISIQMAQGHATITAPPAARAQLVYLYEVTCGYPDDASAIGNYAWQPISSLTLEEPSCPGANERWWAYVGAVGYAVAEGQYPTTAPILSR